MYEATLIKTPTGRYTWVGTLPAEVVYETTDGSKLTQRLIDQQMRLPASYRVLKYRSFQTIKEAHEALKPYRHEVYVYQF